MLRNQIMYFALVFTEKTSIQTNRIAPPFVSEWRPPSWPRWRPPCGSVWPWPCMWWCFFFGHAGDSSESRSG